MTNHVIRRDAEDAEDAEGRREVGEKEKGRFSSSLYSLFLRGPLGGMRFNRLTSKGEI